eukprot:gene439-625_t
MRKASTSPSIAILIMGLPNITTRNFRSGAESEPSLWTVVRFVEAEGYTSRHGLTLVDKGSRFEWVDSSS